MIRCDIAEYMLNPEEIDADNNLIYKILPEKLYLKYDSYMMDIFSPFYDSLSYYVSCIFESGIRKYWRILSPDYSKFRFKQNFRNANKSLLLTMDDFQFIFLFLLLGLSIALLVFILEIFIKLLK